MPGLILTARDLGFLQAVREHRLLRSTHLIALAGDSQQVVLRRLQLLFHHGYLDRPLAQLNWYARGSQPMVYALGSRGAKTLAVDASRNAGVRWDTKNGRLSRVHLEHTLAVADVMVGLEVACRRAAGMRFIPPEEILAQAPPQTQRRSLPFRWHVEIRANGRSQLLGVEPDRAFGLHFESTSKSRQPAFFFLEADRGTMPVVRKGLAQTSFARKLFAYEATWRQRLHTAHFGWPSFRVLTVSTGAERVRHLVTACQSLTRGRGLFLFTHGRGRLGGEDFLTRDWVNARGETVRAPLTIGREPSPDPVQRSISSE